VKSDARIVGILVLAVLSFGACNKTSGEQSDQNAAKQKSASEPGSGSAAAPNSSDSSTE
jgi:hypothetical protein